MQENQKDQLVWDLIKAEEARQERGIELIASENFVSKEVMAAQGSVLTNKYAEGYPKKRYYGGCEFVDQVEQLAIDRIKELFGAEYANVQPHSGSQANMAVFRAVLTPGDKILGMDLSHGGHLTHGSPANFSGKDYQVIPYGVDSETETIDYDALAELAKKETPKLIIAGASAYPRVIDFQKMAEIAKSVGAYFMVDMAHIAGLVAAGLHPNPVPYADFVTSTTHKTLRGPRGGLILAKADYEKVLNSVIFPGIQGGPLEHVIAAKAIAFGEALQPSFKTYAQQIIANAKAMAQVFLDADAKLVSGGTDNHLMLLNVLPFGLNGKEAQELLDQVDITVNKNTIPSETLSPFKTSGIRIGTPAITTRGFKEKEAAQVASLILKTLTHKDDPAVLASVKEEVHALTAQFPIYQ